MGRRFPEVLKRKYERKLKFPARGKLCMRRKLLKTSLRLTPEEGLQDSYNKVTSAHDLPPSAVT